MTTPSEALLSQLAVGCMSPPDVVTLLSRSLPLVREIAGAASAYVLSGQAEDVKVAAHSGARLPIDALSSDIADDQPGWWELPVPIGWRDSGVRRAMVRRLSGQPRPLVFVLTYDHDAARSDLLDVVGALLETAVKGVQTAADLTDLTLRVDNAQHLANMGDYDWHIASELNPGVDDDLPEPLDGEDLEPGDLVRDSATTLRGRTEVPAGPDPTPVVVEPATNDRRVLIVDDSEDMRMLVRLFLDREEGVQVVGETASGREGILLARELQPDLVLLDLAMPEMDGLEALPHILTGAPRAKVIVLSGFDRHLGDQALALGASRFVQKGGGLNELMRAIEATLDNGAPPQCAAH